MFFPQHGFKSLSYWITIDYGTFLVLFRDGQGSGGGLDQKDRKVNLWVWRFMTGFVFFYVSFTLSYISNKLCFILRRRNFPFRKQAMPFLRHLENFSTGRESLSY